MIAKAGLIPFQYNDADGTTGLYLKAKIKDITNLASIVNLSDVPMTDLGNGAYAGQFTGVAGKLYSISMKVYSDAGMTILDPNYGTADTVVQCVDLSSGGGSSELRFESKLIYQPIKTMLKKEVIQTVLRAEIIEEVP